MHPRTADRVAPRRAPRSLADAKCPLERRRSCESRIRIRPIRGRFVYLTPLGHAPIVRSVGRRLGGGRCARRRAGPARSATHRPPRCRSVRTGERRRRTAGPGHQGLWRRAGRRPHRPRGPQGRVLQPPRPVRLRQDDDAADDRRVRAADVGPDRARRPGRHLAAAVPAARQHGLPELRAVPAPDDLGERRLRPASAPASRTRRSRAASATCSSSSSCPASTSASRPRSRAARRSGSRSRGRSSTGRRCSSSTSRWAPSTSSCASRCRSSSSASSRRSGSRSST